MRAEVAVSHAEAQVVSLRNQRSMRDLFHSEFERIVQEAASNCPVSRALAGVEITVDVEPVSADAGADSSPTELRPAPARAEGWGPGRERRALEGRVVSGIRAQSRRRRSTSAERSPALASPRSSGVPITDLETP
jgi:hypothetical protein